MFSEYNERVGERTTMTIVDCPSEDVFSNEVTR